MTKIVFAKANSKYMKKTALILAMTIIALLSPALLLSATPPPTLPPVEKTYTEMFDSVFQNISRSDATTGILYERSIPFAQLYNFNSNVSSVDTSSSEHFMRAYCELYDAAFKLHARLPYDVDSLKFLIEDSGNIVDIGILHYKFNTFDSATAYQKLYFGADSVLLENTTITTSLYLEKTAFVVSPLSKAFETTGITFRFDNSFNFDNTGASLIILMADFDDGQGWRQVYMGSSSFAYYNNSGQKTLQFAALYSNGQILTAYATIDYSGPPPMYFQSSSAWEHYEDSTITAKIPYSNSYGEGNMRIYYADSEKILRKPILIVDGFDPGNKRKFEWHEEKGEKSIWALLGYDNKHIGIQLLGKKYDLVILDFSDGGGDIEKNAMVCIEAINIINRMLQKNCSEHKIVVIGPSMGGQITRYALTYMEQNRNANTNYGEHNCDLWVSFDSPHQGANISLGAQAFIKSNDDDKYKKMICCKAAKQMLIHHREDDARLIHQTYYDGLIGLNPATNGYPANLRKIAVANGCLNNTYNKGTASETAFRATLYFTLYTLDFHIRNAPNPPVSTYVFETKHWGLFIPIPGAKYRFANTTTGKCSPDIAPGSYYNTYDVIKGGIYNKWKATTVISTNQHTHCFMPTTSVLDIKGNYNYCTDFRNVNFETPFDAYYAPDTNMEHVTFNDEIATFLLDEIETSFESKTTIPNPYRYGVIGIGYDFNIFDTLHIYDKCDKESSLPDTIYYKDENDIDRCINSKNIYFSRMPGMGLINWYINEDFVKEIVDGDGDGTFFKTHSFILSNYAYLWENENYTDDYITVKTEFVDTTGARKEIVFILKVNDNSRIATEFANNNPTISVEGNTGTMEILSAKDGQLSQTIHLPESCSYALGNYESNKFKDGETPHIDNNTLTFELKAGFGEAKIPITLSCGGCYGVFILKLKEVLLVDVDLILCRDCQMKLPDYFAYLTENLMHAYAVDMGNGSAPGTSPTNPLTNKEIKCFLLKEHIYEIGISRLDISHIAWYVEGKKVADTTATDSLHNYKFPLNDYIKQHIENPNIPYMAKSRIQIKAEVADTMGNNMDIYFDFVLNGGDFPFGRVLPKRIAHLVNGIVVMDISPDTIKSYLAQTISPNIGSDIDAVRVEVDTFFDSNEFDSPYSLSFGNGWNSFALELKEYEGDIYLFAANACKRLDRCHSGSCYYCGYYKKSIGCMCRSGYGHCNHWATKTHLETFPISDIHTWDYDTFCDLINNHRYEPIVGEPIVTMPLGMIPGTNTLISSEKGVRSSYFRSLCSGTNYQIPPPISIPMSPECAASAYLLPIRLGNTNAFSGGGSTMSLSSLNPRLSYDGINLNIYLSNMRFSSSVSFNSNIQPYPLAPTNGGDFTGYNVIIPYSHNGQLYYKTGTVIPNIICPQFLGININNVSASTICINCLPGNAGLPAAPGELPYMAWISVVACDKTLTIPYPFFNATNNCELYYKESFDGADGFDINANFANDLLNLNIETETGATATLDIYDISGTKIATRTFDLSNGTNAYSYSTSNYTSGTYFYNITIDGNLLFDGQFTIVR